jgi:hypothetical protein
MNHVAQWHDYFTMVGAGAAALTGLVFVAMSLHLDEVARDPAHRHRARTILAGLTAVFIRCAFALMVGQGDQAVALEFILILVVVEVILYRSISQALGHATSPQPGLLTRTLSAFICLVVEQAGAVVLFLGGAWGLYAIGAGMMASFVVMVTGAWLLIVGVRTIPAQNLTA